MECLVDGDWLENITRIADTTKASRIVGDSQFFKFEIKDDNLVIKAWCVDCYTAWFSTPCRASEDASFCVNRHVFSDAVAALPKSAGINLSTDGKHARLSAHSQSVAMPLGIANFAEYGTGLETTTFHVEHDDFVLGFKKIFTAIERIDAVQRGYLVHAMFMDIQSDGMTLYATDSRMVSMVQVPSAVVEQDQVGPRPPLVLAIPFELARAISQCHSKLLGHSVLIKTDERCVALDFGVARFVCPLVVSGRVPPLDAMLNHQGNLTKAQFNRKEMVDAVRLATVVADADGGVTTAVTLGETGDLTMRINTESGSSVAVVRAVEFEGPASVHVNGRRLADALASSSDEIVHLVFSDDTRQPMWIHNDAEWTSLLMLVAPP